MNPPEDNQELDLLLPSSVTGPLWRSLLRNLRDRFFPEKLPPLELTSRPVNTGMLIGDAANLQRPLLILHGLADDNVVVAHTLRLSSALLAAGRPHCVLPLSGVTHMTPQEVVAENQLRLELEFLQRSLGLLA